jgi:autotransporter-associated beta strand protein
MDKDGNRPLNGGTGTPGNFDECSDPAWFTGATATTFYGGNVPVYAPNPYEDGSSLLHLDESRIPNALMSPSIDPGQMARQPLRVEWEIMKDLGWSVLTTKTWTKGAGTLSWSDPANWGPDGTPDATWDVTFASSGLADGDTVDIVGNRSVNILTVGSTKSFTIGGSSGALTITKGNLTRTAGSSGTQTLARPVILGTSAVWDIGGTGQLSVTGAISGTSVGLEKRGAGVLVLSGANTYSGPTAVRGGTLKLAGGSTGSSAFTVESGATLVSAATTFTLSCPLDNAGTVQVQAGKLTLGGGGTGTGAFSVASGATLVSASPTFAISGSLDNAGTVEVSGGTLTLSGPVAQRVGTALTGGTWRVGTNSTLNITTGSSITTNQGTVILDGPNSLFAKIDSLADNQGMLSVQNGRDFTPAGDLAGNLANSGTLTVGAGSTLIVGGTYSQTGGTMTADGTFRVLGDFVNLLGGVMNADTDLGGAMEMDLTVNVTDATLNFGCNQHLDTLSIGHDGKVVFTGAQVVVLNHLVMGGVDLGATILTPEPATLGLLALGGLGLLLRRKRR